MSDIANTTFIFSGIAVNIISPLEGVYMWSFIPGWNLSRDETIPVYGETPIPIDMFAEMKFHPRMKKKQNL